MSRATAATVAVGGLAALTTAVLLSPATLSAGPDVCPFRRLTGLPCPACGLTRSWIALGHGDLLAAFGYNAFGPLFMAVALVGTAVAIATVVTGRRVLSPSRAALAGRIAGGVLVVWLFYGVVRIVFAAAGWGVFPSVT